MFSIRFITDNYNNSGSDKEVDGRLLQQILQMDPTPNSSEHISSWTGLDTTVLLNIFFSLLVGLQASPTMLSVKTKASIPECFCTVLQWFHTFLTNQTIWWAGEYLFSSLTTDLQGATGI